jgi:hypothetical protein
MSPFAAGSQHGLRYGLQGSGFGTAATAMTSLRHTSCSIVPPKRDGKESEELTTERQITDIALGTKKQAGDFGYELSYGELDAMMEAMLGGTWAAAYNLTGQSLTVVKTAKTFQRTVAGDFVADGVQVGDIITTTGFADAENNGSFRVATVVANLITVSLLAGSPVLKDVTDDTGCTIATSTQKLENGVTSRYFTFERAFADITQYGVAQDCQIDKWTLEAKLEQKVKGKFSVIGAGVSSYSATPIDGTPTDSQENNPIEAFNGVLSEGGGAALAILNGLDLSADNQGEADYVILNAGDATAAQLNQGRFKLTGSLDLYFTDLTFHTKILAGTESSLDFDLGTRASGKCYRVYLPRIKYTGLEDPVTNDKRIMMKAPFQALRDSTTNKTIQIWRFPGA